MKNWKTRNRIARARAPCIKSCIHIWEHQRWCTCMRGCLPLSLNLAHIVALVRLLEEASGVIRILGEALQAFHKGMTKKGGNMLRAGSPSGLLPLACCTWSPVSTTGHSEAVPLAGSTSADHPRAGRSHQCLLNMQPLAGLTCCCSPSTPALTLSTRPWPPSWTSLVLCSAHSS